MKKWTLSLIAFLVCSGPSVSGQGVPQSTDEPRFHVRIQSSNVVALRAALEADGYDILAAAAAGTTIDLAVTQAEWNALSAMGHQATLVARSHPLRARLESAAEPRAVPATYLDLDGTIAKMQEIAAAFPAIARVVDVTAASGAPQTFEGRHLFALKISDNVSLDEDEPAMLIVSAHHAREIVSPVITLLAAERLTAGYQTDPRITAAVNGHEIWIAPVWNPDGYNYVFTTDNLWRKNRRVFPGGVGVDQNRNYAQGWGAACAGSTTVSSETYKGPSAASEAETQTMMAWSQRERFAKVIDYHSTGREVLYAYRCLSHPFTAWWQQQATALSQISGYGGTTRLPSAEGEHPEWQFAQMGAYAFLIETHTEFQPSYDSALSEAMLVWPGILSVLERPISITGRVSAAASGLPLAAKIELLNVTFSNGESNGSGGPYGRYHLFLPAGTYDVRFSAAGYVPATHRVAVTATSAMNLDVQLAERALATPTGLRVVP
jgi:hypothetical protein